MSITLDGTTGIVAPAIDVATPITVSDGGTGASTLTSNNVLLGAGTSAVTFVAPGSSGNVLTSDGTTWASAAAGGGQFQNQLFTAPGTWTKPASCTQVRVIVVGGGGGGGSVGAGGVGGFAIAMVPVSAPVAITVGAGGAASPATTGGSGGTSSFGPAVSATGGAGGTSSANGANGTGTTSVGTELKRNVAGTVNYNVDYGLSSSVLFFGNARDTGPGKNAAIAYSSSLAEYAGASGRGTPTAGNRAGGVGGAILVEFVG